MFRKTSFNQSFKYCPNVCDFSFVAWICASSSAIFARYSSSGISHSEYNVFNLSTSALYIASCSSVEMILLSSNASHQKTNHKAPTNQTHGHQSNVTTDVKTGKIFDNANVTHATAVQIKSILLASSGFSAIRFETFSMIGVIFSRTFSRTGINASPTLVAISMN